jgi:hypothetical protein
MLINFRIHHISSVTSPSRVSPFCIRLKINTQNLTTLSSNLPQSSKANSFYARSSRHFRAAFMMSSVVYSFCKLTKNLLWLMNYLEESHQFHSLRPACLTNLKGSVGLILAKASDMSEESSLATLSPFPRSFSSIFCLSGTGWVFIWSYRFFYSS